MSDNLRATVAWKNRFAILRYNDSVQRRHFSWKNARQPKVAENVDNLRPTVAWKNRFAIFRYDDSVQFLHFSWKNAKQPKVAAITEPNCFGGVAASHMTIKREKPE